MIGSPSPRHAKSTEAVVFKSSTAPSPRFSGPPTAIRTFGFRRFTRFKMSNVKSRLNRYNDAQTKSGYFATTCRAISNGSSPNTPSTFSHSQPDTFAQAFAKSGRANDEWEYDDWMFSQTRRIVSKKAQASPKACLELQYEIVTYFSTLFTCSCSPDGGSAARRARNCRN